PRAPPDPRIGPQECRRQSVPLPHDARVPHSLRPQRHSRSSAPRRVRRSGGRDDQRRPRAIDRRYIDGGRAAARGQRRVTCRGTIECDRRIARVMLERLQKIIAHAGVASRREAESMIREGRVTLNGRVVTELGTKADADRDHIKVDGKLITRAEPHRYILLYKPKEVMTTVEDPQGRRTVIDLVRGIRERIYPVGRLDFHSEGLVLLTNDGELAFKVSHPTHGSVKTYSVKVRGVPEERLVDKLRRGITIDSKRTLPCDIERMHTTGKRDDEGNS